MRQRALTRAALLLALALLFQSLRFLLPLPPLFSTFLIGTLVNAVLLVAVETTGRWPAVLIAVITPLVAYLQALLPVPLFVLPVAAGNILLALVFHWLLPRGRGAAIAAAAAVKTVALYSGFLILMSMVALPASVAKGILFVMSWPQLATAIAGGALAAAAMTKINRILR